MKIDSADLLPPLPRRFLSGHDLDLLSPLDWVEPGPSLGQRSWNRGAPRDRIAGSLRDLNVGYGHPRPEALAERLADPETLVVATGQQPGLFGGPLYSLSKAVAAVRWACELERQTSRPAVAVYWIASDDHDFQEIGQAQMPYRGDEAGGAIELEPTEGSCAPVGPQPLGTQITDVLAQRHAAAMSDRYRAWLDELGTIYRPEACFTEAFAQLMVRLLGDRCPLLLDGGAAEIRSLQRPILERLIERRAAVATAEREREGAIADRGFDLQITPQPDCAPLFVLENGRRRRVRWQDRDQFELRGGSLRGGVDDLLGLLDREPERFSPSAQARPAVQDFLLDTAVFLVGPGEASYLAQASALYPVLEAPPSAVALRPQVLLADRRRLEQLEDLAACGIPIETLIGNPETLEAALAASASCPDDPVAEGCDRVRDALAALREPARRIDPQLDAAWEKTRSHVDRALEAFEGRTRSARAHADRQRSARVTALRDLLVPGGRLHERTVAVAHFAGVYGDDFATAIYDGMTLDPSTVDLLDATARPPSDGDGACDSPALAPEGVSAR